MGHVQIMLYCLLPFGMHQNTDHESMQRHLCATAHAMFALQKLGDNKASSVKLINMNSP